MQNVTPPAVLRVELNGPVTEIKGITWPRRDNGKLSEMKCVQDPCEVQLVFPSGQVFSSYSKILIIEQENNRVWNVAIAPFDRALPYREAAATLSTIVADIEQRFQVTAKASAHAKTHSWKAAKPEPPFEKWATRVELEPNISLFIELKESNKENDTWFVNLEFSFETAEPEMGK
jgi:hypothetical protein